MMTDLFIQNGYAWAGIHKNSTKYFRHKFVYKLSGSDFYSYRWEISTPHSVVKKQVDEFIEKTKIKKLKLLCHLRDPWDHFKASIRTDLLDWLYNNGQKVDWLTGTGQAVNKENILNFCQNIENEYLDFEFYNKQKLDEYKIKKGWNILLQNQTDRIFDTIKLLKNYLIGIEFWRAQSVQQSIKKCFNYNSPDEPYHRHSDWYKSTVDNFFDERKDFFNAWKKVNSHPKAQKIFDVIPEAGYKYFNLKDFIKFIHNER